MKKTAGLKSIGAKFTFWTVLLIVAIISIVGLFTYYKDVATMNKNLDSQVKLCMDNVESLSMMYKKESKDQITEYINNKLSMNVDVSMSIANKYYNDYNIYLKQNPDLSSREKETALKKYQQKALDAIGVLRYDNGDGYIWVNDMKGIMLEHPKEELIGKSVYDVHDKNGKYMFREMIKVCREKGSGFVDYLWPKLGEDQPQPKRSFVKEFKPWGWIIGTGEYINDQQALIAKREKNLFKSYKERVLKVKFIGNSYPVIFSKNGDQLLFKVYLKPELEGKPLPSTDPKGNPLATAIKGDSGVVHYFWPKSGEPENKLFKKTLWYRYLPDLNWYVVFSIYDSEVYGPIYKEVWTIELLMLGGAFALILVIILLVRTIITKKIKVLPKAMEDFSKGDLTIHLKEPKSKDEISTVIKATNAAIKGLEKLILHLKDGGRDLNNVNEKIKVAVEETQKIDSSIEKNTADISSDAQNISANIEEVNAGQEEFTAGMQRIADEASIMSNGIDKIKGELSKVSKSSDDALDVTNKLKENSDKTMESVREMMNQISSITDFAISISSIAEQTNLLALNAAIEAARAGKSGKGFAVIADEIRDLANESKLTAERIKESVDKIKVVSDNTVEQVTSTNNNVNMTIENITELIDDIKSINDRITEISNSVTSVSSSVENSKMSAEELSTAIDNIASFFDSIVAKIEEVDNETRKQGSVVKELSAASETLQDVTESINRAIAMFKLKS